MSWVVVSEYRSWVVDVGRKSRAFNQNVGVDRPRTEARVMFFLRPIFQNALLLRAG